MLYYFLNYFKKKKKERQDGKEYRRKTFLKIQGPTTELRSTESN